MAGRKRIYSKGCQQLKKKKIGNMPLNEYCLECPNECLSSMQFLLELPEDKRKEIMDYTYREFHSKGSYLFHEGDKVDALFIIHTGQVKLSTYDGYGKEQIIGIFADDEAIWEGILIDESKYPYNAVCISDVECLKVQREPFEKLLKEPAVSLQIIGILSRKLHFANERNRILSLTEPVARVAGFLLYRLRTSETDRITCRLSEIAASVNLRPETVSRKVSELEKEHVIERVAQSTIKILDAERLEKIFVS